MLQKLQWPFLTFLLVPVIFLGIDGAWADTSNMVVQVRKTGGGVLNGAQVCVGQRANPCPNRPTSTKGRGLAVVKTGGTGSVLVTVSHPDYKSQQRVVNFKPGQPSVRFILEPKSLPPVIYGLPGPYTIRAMDINGGATYTTNPRIRIGWHTGFHASHYRISLTPNFSDVSWVRMRRDSQSGTAFFTIPSPVNGTVYTIYLQAKLQNSINPVGKSASITFGSPPGPTTKTFKVAGAKQIDDFLRAARDKGYRFSSRATTPQTRCRTRTFRYLTSQSDSTLMDAKVTCRYEYFQRGGPNLVTGWRLKSVLFRKRCFRPRTPCPLNKFSVVGPKNTIDPYFMVLHQPPFTGGRLELIGIGLCWTRKRHICYPGITMKMIDRVVKSGYSLNCENIQEWKNIHP